MIRSKLCEFLGIKYPIIQAGMGPFSNNKLCIATANAGILGLLSTSGITAKETQPGIYKNFAETGGASTDDEPETIFRKIFDQTFQGTREKGGVFGINVMVAEEMKDIADFIINTAIKVREERPELKEQFKVVFTSAGDPLPWGEKIKGAGFKWLHIVPSVKGALRCKKAGVDLVVASGHEGGFHTSWEPVHSMVLLPAVVEALEDTEIMVVGAGGFCDGKTLAASLALGAVGAQMGTRFLATKESDFAQLWKEGVTKAGDRGTLVARGFVGPARWLKNPVSLKHQENTLKYTPELFLDRPGGLSEGALKLIENEINGLNATSTGEEGKALMAGGECAQRVDDLPPVQELVDRIVKEATEIVKGFAEKHLPLNP
ncbi:MAG: nitronate monooxygenase [Deltaproteobacteria bacterium]|nr:nitronate monooxygenase [Deltaproteobacteria bacterium]